MTWTQVYDPLGHWWLSTLVAALPIIVLLGLLAGIKVRPHLCAVAGAATAVICAMVVFGMPARLAVSSFFYGSAFGLLKIVWIVIAAVFLYDISVETGQFEIMKQSVAAITPDRRLQLLLVAFCFGAFIEGSAGFGAPVAIAGAFMIGLGFKPFQAAALNLIANTAPVAWGAIGTPVHALASVTGLPESDLSAMIGRILPITAVIVPFWLVRAMVSWSETFEVLPAILMVGCSFAVTQWFWANRMDSNLVDIAAGVVSLIATMLFLRVWKPKRIWRFEGERQEDAAKAARNEMAKHYSGGQTAKAWLPFAILSVIVLVWGLPAVKLAMNQATTPAFKVMMPDGKPRPGPAGWDWPYLHAKVFRTVPVVQKATAEAARFDFNWLTATGTGCFLAAILSALLLGLGPGRIFQLFGHTLVRLRFAVVAMTCMLGLGYVTRYSGMDAVLGLAFTRTGWFFPFFGTFIGWLGVALTGSDTSSNVLFGGLQKITAQQLNLSPILMCAANSAGGVMGKMIDAQSICIATAATNQVGNEGSIFRFVFWHSVALAAIVGFIVMLYAYVFQQAIPNGLNFIH
ncbi:MAG: lactate permease [Acidobacteria bacterium]|nr:MAG: lactate permease [Acidobacteriota bacterium]PYU43635.1 MAG: lactate permease [Acidobacteriota bacterium]PYU75420.1 MAG: lactate permease [Acidobacteriota bacterium]